MGKLIKIKTYVPDDYIGGEMIEWGKEEIEAGYPLPNNGLWCKYEDVKGLIEKLIDVLSEEIVI